MSIRCKSCHGDITQAIVDWKFTPDKPWNFDNPRTVADSTIFIHSLGTCPHCGDETSVVGIVDLEFYFEDADASEEDFE